MASIPAIEDRPIAAVAPRSDTLADSVLILLALTAVQRLVGFCRAILFCRWLSPEQLGQWDMAFGFLMLAGPLSVLALSGSFGRYVETYRQQGQLRALLRRTAVFCGGAALLAAALIWLARRWFSLLIFGPVDELNLVPLLAGSLVAVIACNYLTDLFIGLRSARTVAALQLLNSLAFAALSIGLLCARQCSVENVVLAYGAACVVSAVAAIWPLRRIWRACPDGSKRLPQRALWSKLIPFAAWIWIGSFLANLFDVADRYMIVHCSSFLPDEALALVGHYHSSRVVPLLLVSIAGLLGTIITPYLSHDWEQGHRRRVAARLNLFLKLLGFAMAVGATLVLFAAPLLFGVAFRGKFAEGLAVLPWTLTYCTWFGLATVAENYLWCCEKARLGSAALLIGLAMNIALNLVLLPRMGLPGAVLATSAANLAVLLLVCAFNHRLGFRMDRGAWLVLALPPLVCLGPWIAALMLAAVAVEAVRCDRLLSAEEKRQLVDGCREYLQRLKAYRSASGPSTLT